MCKLTIRAGDPWEMKAGRIFIGTCETCTNPDSYGDGAVEFYGKHVQDISDQFITHERTFA